VLLPVLCPRFFNSVSPDREAGGGGGETKMKKLKKGFVGYYRDYAVFVKKLRPLRVVYTDGNCSWENNSWKKKELQELRKQYLREESEINQQNFPTHELGVGIAYNE